MATRRRRQSTKAKSSKQTLSISTPIEELLMNSLERGEDTLETGRYIITYKEGMAETGVKELKSQSFRTADSRDFNDQNVSLEDCGDADALVFSEIGCAVMGGEAFEAHNLSVNTVSVADSAIDNIEPEYFVFAYNSEYLRGFASAVNTIVNDLNVESEVSEYKEDLESELTSITWGIRACNVHKSIRSGRGIKVAVLDTGMDRDHKDFKNRDMKGQSFVGQPIQDLHGHGTHCIGTACGPANPVGTKFRYGVAYDSHIYVGKVLTNSGVSVGASVLSGMNWAIAKRCEVISMSLGGPNPPQRAYTNAGAAALRNGLLIIAAAGNDNTVTGSPANSPTILSVASLDINLRRSWFSNHTKIELAGPGGDIFSAWPRPQNYNTISGTSMATPHVAGCAALWAESDPSLRGMNLWRRLEESAKPLRLPRSKVGSGLVQAPR